MIADVTIPCYTRTIFKCSIDFCSQASVHVFKSQLTCLMQGNCVAAINDLISQTFSTQNSMCK